MSCHAIARASLRWRWCPLFVRRPTCRTACSTWARLVFRGSSSRTTTPGKTDVYVMPPCAPWVGLDPPRHGAPWRSSMRSRTWMSPRGSTPFVRAVPVPNWSRSTSRSPSWPWRVRQDVALADAGPSPGGSHGGRPSRCTGSLPSARMSAGPRTRVGSFDVCCARRPGDRVSSWRQRARWSCSARPPTKSSS